MGNQDSQPAPSLNKLIVATLNYCGIMNCPYEFYINKLEHDLRKIGDIFTGYAVKYKVPGFDPNNKDFKWPGAKIDHYFRKDRYTSMFTRDVGIENGVFLSEAEFKKKWDEVFDAKHPKKPYKK